MNKDSKVPDDSLAFSEELQSQWPMLSAWLLDRARELGFDQLAITDLDVKEAQSRLRTWLDRGHHGQMHYMENRVDLRANPQTLLPDAVRSICLTMPYLGATHKAGQSTDSGQSVDALLASEEERLVQGDQATISLYARGRDYHKVIRTRLQILAQELSDRIQETLATIDSASEIYYRVFTDSAPLMEVELARKAGLGWRGKHTLLLNREAGSFFFLGEILINLPLPIDAPIEPHCGSCTACIDICPTQAIIAPYQLDARRCISYLTIEHLDAIPVEFRRAMGNRVYGCDDCQLVCPWNKYAKRSTIPDFVERHQLGSSSLLELWAWSETQFTERHAGSAIYRIGYERWRRNLAVALGNALAADLEPKTRKKIREELENALPSSSPLVAEHIAWALSQDASQSNRSLGASL
jgi:epoxyqueuosine reductase